MSLLDLWETNHYCDFYRKTNIAGLKKKVNSEPLHIRTRKTDASDLDILGIQDAKWANEKEVHMSPYIDTTIKLE